MFFPLSLLIFTLLTQAGQPQAPVAPQAQANANEELWDAARAGDVARVTRALDRGTDVNAKSRYGATALTFAADKGHLAVVTLLIARGADVNVQDTFYKMRAIDMALSNKHSDVARLLLDKGSKGAAAALTTAVENGDAALAKTALASAELTPANINSALALAKRTNKPELADLLTAKLATLPATAKAPAVMVDRSTLQAYVGSYRSDALGITLAVALAGDQLTVTVQGQPPLTLVPTSQTNFAVAEAEGFSFAFSGRGGTIERVLSTRGTGTQAFERMVAPAPSATPAPSASPATSAAAAAKPDPVRPSPRTAARPWPGFRGDNASGNGDGQGAVVEWNIERNQNIRWKTPIPGIANASPIVSGNRVFVVTAISSAGDKTFRTGLYGDVAPVNDLSTHTWKIYALDKATGKILWERTAFTGLPKVKRHPKASQANSTPVTDGKRVVAIFGSIGLLAAWDVAGKPLWTKDVGVLDSGWFFDPDYQWGHSSSPLIYGNTVIVQADRQKQSFLAAYNLDSGKEAWRTERDEISTWGTPTLFRAGGRDQIVTNGPKVRGYDAETGKLLWTLGPNSEVTVGTPVVGDGLVYVTGGYPPVRPIYAVKPNASGEITPSAGDAVAWSNGEGTYIPTPIFYNGILYTCANQGVLSAYDGKTGERIYRARIGNGGSFAASPIAADGRLYLANEDGEVYVVRAGRTYEELAKNEMKEVIMSTPAISDGLIVIRTLGHVYGVGQ
jgi:outer membrane protein assembly factor BamB/antitoxin (DNA-binding transcriptional repressor) of toxin-antitoxin stability system